MTVCAATMVFSAATAGGKVGVGPLGVADGASDDISGCVGVTVAALQLDRIKMTTVITLTPNRRTIGFDI